MKKIAIIVLMMASMAWGWDKFYPTFSETKGYKPVFTKYKNRPGAAGWILYPKDYNPLVAYPMVVFVPGSGEAGDMSRTISNRSLWQAWSTTTGYQEFYNNPNTNCFVFLSCAVYEAEGVLRDYNGVAPIESSTGWWFDTSIDAIRGMLNNTITFYTDETIETSVEYPEFNIDPNRIYFIGYSFGAGEAHSFIDKGRDLFAAQLWVDYTPTTGYNTVNSSISNNTYYEELYANVEHVSTILIKANNWSGTLLEGCNNWFEYSQSSDNSTLKHQCYSDLSTGWNHGSIFDALCSNDLLMFPDDESVDLRKDNGTLRTEGWVSPIEYLFTFRKNASTAESPYPYTLLTNSSEVTFIEDNTTMTAERLVVYKWVDVEDGPLYVDYAGIRLKLEDDGYGYLVVNGTKLDESNNFTFTYQKTPLDNITLTQRGEGSQLFQVNMVSTSPTSLNFYVTPTGNDNNSGSDPNDNAIWTGTASCTSSSQTITRVSGDEFTSALVNKRIRMISGTTNLVNYIIACPDPNTLTCRDNMTSSLTGADAKIGGALKTLPAAFGYATIVWCGTATSATTNLILDSNFVSKGTVDGTTLTDATKSWTANRFISQMCLINGVAYNISANTGTTLTLSAAPSAGDYNYTIVAADPYTVITRVSDNSTFTNWDTAWTLTSFFAPFSGTTSSITSAILSPVSDYRDNSTMRLLGRLDNTAISSKYGVILQRNASYIPYYSTTTNSYRNTDITIWIKGTGNLSSPDYVIDNTTILYDYSSSQTTSAASRRIIGYQTTPGDGGYQSDGTFKGPTIGFTRTFGGTEIAKIPCWIIQGNNMLFQNIGIVYDNDSTVSGTSTSYRSVPLVLLQGNNQQIVFMDCLFYSDVDSPSRNPNFISSTLLEDGRLVTGCVVNCKFKCNNEGYSSSYDWMNIPTYNCVFDNASAASAIMIKSKTNLVFNSLHNNLIMDTTLLSPARGGYLNSVFLGKDSGVETLTYSPSNTWLYGCVGSYAATEQTSSKTLLFGIDNNVLTRKGTYTEGKLNWNYLNIPITFPDGTKSYMHSGRQVPAIPKNNKMYIFSTIPKGDYWKP